MIKIVSPAKIQKLLELQKNLLSVDMNLFSVYCIWDFSNFVCNFLYFVIKYIFSYFFSLLQIRNY